MSNVSDREDGLLKAYAAQQKQIEKLKAEVARLKAELKKQNPGVQLAAMRTNPGRKPSGPRCPCGQNSLKRAAARGFDCCKKAGMTGPFLKGTLS